MNHSLLKMLSAVVPNSDEGDKAIQGVEDLLKELQQTKLHLHLLEKAIESDYDSIIITEVGMESPGPRIVYVNDGFTRMTGYSREEAIGQTPRMLQGEKTDRKVLDNLKERLNLGKSFFGHTVNYRKDGSEFINQWDIHPLFNEKNELAYWVSYQHDITERKQSELTTLDADVEFDELMEESKKISLDLDLAGNVLSANKLFRDLSGYFVDQLKTFKIWDLITTTSDESVQQEFSKEHPFEQKHTGKLKTASNLEIEVEISGKKLTAPDQDILRLTIENKTAQSKIMEALRSRSGTMQSLFEPVSFFDYRFQVSGEQVQVEFLADSLERVLGKTSSNLRKIDSGEGFTPFVEGGHQSEYRSFLSRVMAGESATLEYTLSFPGGQPVRVVDYAKPIRDEKTDEITGIRGRISTEISSSS